MSEWVDKSIPTYDSVVSFWAVCKYCRNILGHASTVVTFWAAQTLLPEFPVRIHVESTWIYVDEDPSTWILCGIYVD